MTQTFSRLASDDQGYLKAAREEEMFRYMLEQGVTGEPSPSTTFCYPPNTFTAVQREMDVLVTLEDAFIAAYLVGVRDFSTPDLRVTAARIMGIESDHRTLVRVVAPGVAAQDGGPIEKVAGIEAFERIVVVHVPTSFRARVAGPHGLMKMPQFAGIGGYFPVSGSSGKFVECLPDGWARSDGRRCR